MTKAARYRMPRRFSERGFIERLKREYTVAREAPVSMREAYLDTFDWLLFNESLTLACGEGRLTLRRISTGETVKSQAAPAGEAAKDAGAPGIPRFAVDLPAGGFRDKLASIIDVRALLPVFEAERRVVPLRILDRRRKTVARIEIEDVRLVSGGEAEARFRNIFLRPVRGYVKHAERVARWLDESGYAREDGALFARLAEAAGKMPGDYSAKLRFRLDPETSAYDALIRIFRFLAGVIRRNEEGVRTDIDTEFLHDWRVATRRTRAGLGQLRKVVPKETGKRFRKVFAEFGERTNRLRDLDVYLLKAGEYRSLIPDDIRGDIDPLFEYVRGERAQELDRVRRWMDSGEYEEPLAEWERFLDQPLGEADARADSRTPVIEVASRTIRSRFANVVDRGTEAASSPDDAKLHMLRIECKKLRYLLEFFSSLYPAGPITALVKQLKLLQDNLGRHQDISVQQAGLRSFAGELSAVRKGSERTAVAVGVLVGALENEKQELRGVFGDVFGRFASEENVRLVGELFGKPVEPREDANEGPA